MKYGCTYSEKTTRTKRGHCIATPTLKKKYIASAMFVGQFLTIVLAATHNTVT